MVVLSLFRLVGLVVVVVRLVEVGGCWRLVGGVWVWCCLASVGRSVGFGWRVQREPPKIMNYI
eukprot:scaffold26232_cov76-Cyclotella_meneghiniana.AAC.6